MTIKKIENYLKGHGWAEQDLSNLENRNINVKIYHGPLDMFNKPLVAVIPAFDYLIDKSDRLNDIVRMLSRLEGLSILEMEKKIHSWQAI